jgi:hypothetical protein
MTDASDFDLLLQAVTPVEAEMIKGLLAEAGIPCLVHTQDFDMVELGKGAHDSVRHPDVYVPKGTKDQANAILDEAWEDRAGGKPGASAAE